MTRCNMSIEAGAKAIIAPDDTTSPYLEGRRLRPKGADWEAALADWRTLTDDGAAFDKEVDLDAAKHLAARLVGHEPAQVTLIDGRVPDPDQFAEASQRESAARPSSTWASPRHPDEGGGRHRLHRLLHQLPHRGTCVAAAAVVEGRRQGRRAHAVVPGSFMVRTRRWPRASTRSSSRPASTGASPAVRCAWP